MARKNGNNGNAGSGNPGFEFIWVSWNEKQLAGLKKWHASHEHTLEMCLQSLCDTSWKTSISTNGRSGRYLVSITDKGGRKGCDHRSWGVEHSDLMAAVVGAFYYATEIICDAWETDGAGDDFELF